MSVTWLDHERRLTEALEYIGVILADEKGEPWVLREANLLVEDDEDELVFSVSALARALEALGYRITTAARP